MLSGTVDLDAEGAVFQVGPGASLSLVPQFDGPGAIPSVWTLSWTVQRDPGIPIQLGEKVRFTSSQSVEGGQRNLFRFELDLGGETYGQPSAIGYSFAKQSQPPVNLNPLVCTDPIRPLDMGDLSGELTIDSDFDPIPALQDWARWILVLGLLGVAIGWRNRRRAA